MIFSKRILRLFGIFLMPSFVCLPNVSADNDKLAQTILENAKYQQVLDMAGDVIKEGFTAGEGYGEIWIRDFTTFMKLACEYYPDQVIEEKLNLFFHFQGEDGNIVDGYIPTEQAIGGYEYISSETVQDFKAHKNTVETDQESSLIQGIYNYIQATGNHEYIEKEIIGLPVHRRMEMALEFLMNKRYSQRFGLLWGATTVDWGDVQPEHEWGVFLTEDSHLAIDIYDNAMMLIALEQYLELLGPESDTYGKWKRVQADIRKNVMLHLWDDPNQKFLPHIYLEDSPFPVDFNEHEIFYHGGTIVAMQAGLLNETQILTSLQQMIENTRRCGAASIGLTVYPPYPKGLFKNPILTNPYTYQNGGDWTWFGARIVPVLVEHAMTKEAVEVLQPMVDRVIENQGFYEWYDIYNQPRGSGTYRGSAGVLFEAIHSLRDWAEQQMD